MPLFILGLILFFGLHSFRIVAPALRERSIARLGKRAWMVVYSILSLVGVVVLIWGYGLARQEPIPVWYPPLGLRHLAIALNLLAFILAALYFLPSGRLKARLGHPILLAIKVWAVAHLLANGNLADILLFGAFLVWAVAAFGASRKRDRAAGARRIPGPAMNDVLAVVLGAVVWAAFLWRVHYWLIGVSPLA